MAGETPPPAAVTPEQLHSSLEQIVQGIEANLGPRLQRIEALQQQQQQQLQQQQQQAAAQHPAEAEAEFAQHRRPPGLADEIPDPPSPAASARSSDFGRAGSQFYRGFVAPRGPEDLVRNARGNPFPRSIDAPATPHIIREWHAPSYQYVVQAAGLESRQVHEARYLFSAVSYSWDLASHVALLGQQAQQLGPEAAISASAVSQAFFAIAQHLTAILRLGHERADHITSVARFPAARADLQLALAQLEWSEALQAPGQSEALSGYLQRAARVSSAPTPAPPPAPAASANPRQAANPNAPAGGRERPNRTRPPKGKPKGEQPAQRDTPAA